MPLMKRRAPRYKRKQVIRRRRQMMNKKKISKYAGIRYIKETMKLDDLDQSNDAVIGVAQKYHCSFTDISNTASYAGVGPRNALKALYARYAITGVKYTFIPKYDQSSVGGAKASTVLYAINRDPQDTTIEEEDLIRQNDCKFTNSNRKFTVYIKNPTPALAMTAQTQLQGVGYLSTQYAEPVGLANANRNQVAVSFQGNKWTWLPTRVDVVAGEGTQHPDHYGLDVFLPPNPSLPADTRTPLYSVYQTIYMALKEQD